VAISLRRVAVVGSPGAGKTTLARVLAYRLGVPHVELDAIFHLPDWQELPTDEFIETVSACTSSGGWVVDGNYSRVRDVVWTRADAIVWLDFSRPVVMRRVASRTISRAVRREELWNGNREPWSNLWSWDPNRSIIAWAWRYFDHRRTQIEAELHNPRWADVAFVRLRTPQAADEFLAAV
jgi:adenylate kinase family enzyme